MKQKEEDTNKKEKEETKKDDNTKEEETKEKEDDMNEKQEDTGDTQDKVIGGIFFFFSFKYTHHAPCISLISSFLLSYK